METTDYDSYHLEQVERAQQRNRPPTIPTIGARLAIAEQRPLASRIQERAEWIRTQLKDPATDQRALIKIARAIEEGRIAEGPIVAIFASLLNARSRGAYFLSAVKTQFQKVSLPWFEEEWK